jgi:hypothetical protein
MAYFIPNAGVHTKGSYNSTTTRFLRIVKEEAWMGSGKVGRRTPWQSVQRCAGDCGARVASPCGDDRRHGVAAESLEVLRQLKYFKAGSSNVQSPILEVAKSVLSKFVRTWHRHCETH